jgi:hypothetical protein
MNFNINIPGVLFIFIGINFAIIGFRIIKNNWKEEEKTKQERRAKILGIIFIIGGVLRILWDIIK